MPAGIPNISRWTYSEEDRPQGDHSHFTHQASNMYCLTILTIILTKQTALAQGEADLTLEDNPGLHAFTYYGAFADDISFGKLIVTIDTKRIMKAVQKAAATMDHKINSTSPFLKLMGRRVLESVNPAMEKLNTLDAIPHQAQQSKRDLMGLAALGVAKVK